MDQLVKYIRELIDFTCEKNNVPDLKHKITFEFKQNFTRRLGDANWNPSTKLGKIRFSVPLWSRASEKEKREVVIHETCHIVVGFKYPYATAHGTEWQNAMTRCEIEPNRTHNINRKGLYKRQKKYSIAKCPKTHCCVVNKDQLKLLKSGGSIVCQNCLLSINFHSLKKID